MHITLRPEVSNRPAEWPLQDIPPFVFSGGGETASLSTFEEFP
jgi:hypothetical protein